MTRQLSLLHISLFLVVELEPVAMQMRLPISKLPEARAKPWYFHKKIITVGPDDK